MNDPTWSTTYHAFLRAPRWRRLATLKFKHGVIVGGVSLVVRKDSAGRSPRWLWAATVSFATSRETSREVGQRRGCERTKKAAQAAATAAGRDILKTTK